MSSEIKKQIQLEIGYVLFMDMVGYSTRLITEQRALRDVLNQIVRSTEQFRDADAAGTLIKSPTGDGMALVFHGSPEEPLNCALEISRALKGHPNLPLRMGVHSGPVSAVVDVNDQTGVAGAGIHMAQRVMDCGDAGHILLSKHVAEDLETHGDWQLLLHDLGECEVKHGVRVHLVNLYTEELGNPEPPEKFKHLRGKEKISSAIDPPTARAPRPNRALVIAVVLIAIVLAVATTWFWPRPPPKPVSVSAPAIPEKSIAVLPFENRSRDPDNAYFADGIQDEILTDLAKIADLKVISRTSVMPYKSGLARNLRKIGEELGVAHVVEGSVQRAANKIRVNAQLIDARNDTHLWAQTYDRDLADVFAIQSEIAKAIADQLQAELSPNEKKAIEQPPTTDLAAFALYTHAQNLLLTSFSSTAKAKLEQAADLLGQAVTRDPSFFHAYCQLAYAHDQLYLLGFDHTAARLALAEAAVQVAIRLRPDAAETHIARARNLYYGPLDYDGALDELKVARQTLPNDPRISYLTGVIQRRQGRWEESTRNLERAIEFDPRNFFTLKQIALSYGLLHRYDEETSVLKRALAVKPDDVDTKIALAAVQFHWKANTQPVRQTVDSIRSTNPSALANIANDWLSYALAERNIAAAKDALDAFGDTPLTDYAVHINRSLMEGLMARMTKDESKARAAFTAARANQEKIIQAQPNYAPPLCVLGLIDAGLGRKDEALREGRRAVQLLPVEKDAINGPLMVEYLAMIAAWVGDKDLACEQLAIAVRPPSTVSYGQLKLLPFWDPLRGDPRFEQIVASLAPKDAKP